MPGVRIVITSTGGLMKLDKLSGVVTRNGDSRRDEIVTVEKAHS